MRPALARRVVFHWHALALVTQSEQPMGRARVTAGGWELAAAEMPREPVRQVAARAPIAQARRPREELPLAGEWRALAAAAPRAPHDRTDREGLRRRLA
jgi:hypothetical protein